MNRLLSIFAATLLILCFCSCKSSRGTGPVTPETVDTTPPVWDSTEGITNAVAGDKSVTVYWGTARDEESPPVFYILYMDTDEDPWDQTPVGKYTNGHHTYYDLTNDQQYWFGVRCQDNASPPNVDSNNVVLSATPQEVYIPPSDTDPPVWDNTTGIVGAYPDDGRITLEWGTATDEESPPVMYLLYVGMEENPFSSQAIELSSNDPYVYESPYAYSLYYFGVRCKDSANPPNIDTNEIVLAKCATDRRPPYWDDTIGITDVIPGNGKVTLYWGTATDADSPPVEYLVYASNNIDNHELWSNEPITCQTNDPLTITGLIPGETYWFGVRAQDDARPYKNHDNNKVILSAEPTGHGSFWVRRWEERDHDGGHAIATDSSGNVFVTSSFRDYVDFDPGPDVDQHISNGDNDVYLSKLDSYGIHCWTQTWGGEFQDAGIDVVIDDADSIYVTGYFRDYVDFDPGPGVYELFNPGHRCMFLSKFDTGGNLTWALNWGKFELMGLPESTALDLDESGNILITGIFHREVDFDPGPGEDIHGENQQFSDEVFLVKLDSNGNYAWAKTWGGVKDDHGVDVTSDQSGNIYVTGDFRGTVDFDPGDGVNEHSTIANPSDVFLSKFDSDGNFKWVRTWGAEKRGDYSQRVICFDSGDILVKGWCYGDIDLDPDPVGEAYFSEGGSYLSKFNTHGDFLSGYVYDLIGISGFCIDSNNNILVTGAFKGKLDFDPGPGVVEYTSVNDSEDIFLCSFDSNGMFNWAKIFAGEDDGCAYNVTVDNSENIFVIGEAGENVDFDSDFGISIGGDGSGIFLLKLNEY